MKDEERPGFYEEDSWIGRLLSPTNDASIKFPRKLGNFIMKLVTNASLTSEI